MKQFKKRVEEKKVQPSDDAFTFIHEALPKGPVVVPTPKVQTEASGKSNRALKKVRFLVRWMLRISVYSFVGLIGKDQRTTQSQA